MVLIAGLSVPAYGWNGCRHMMVAAVAYQQLTPAMKDPVDVLLLLNPDPDNWLALIPAGTSPDDIRMMVFMIAATWPDRIKSDHAYPIDGTNHGNTPPTDGTANKQHRL